MLNLPKLSAYFAAKQEEYLLLLIDGMNKGNPGWIEKIKSDKDLINEDGTPKQLSKEEIDNKIKSILESKELNAPLIDKQVVYDLFLIDKETLDKFIQE